jgi:hypothetical protein
MLGKSEKPLAIQELSPLATGNGETRSLVMVKKTTHLVKATVYLRLSGPKKMDEFLLEDIQNKITELLEIPDWELGGFDVKVDEIEMEDYTWIQK